MMRAACLAALLAAGAAGLNLPRQELDGSTGPAPTNDILVFNAPKWPLLSPDQALSALYKKAKATPSAVSILPDVPIPTDVAKALDSTEAHPLTQEEVTKAGEGSNANAPAASSCTSPETHYEWRNLPSAQKLQYLEAMKCLFGQPPRSGLAGVKNRWDDLVAIHQQMSPIIHNVGQFLPWHRYFLKMLEMEMRGTCNYTGSMTWWDETKDAGDFHNAPVATIEYFGHFPRGNPVCIRTGEFKNTQCHIGPGTNNRNHCLQRGVNERTSSAITTGFVNTCLSYNDYNDMQNCFFFGPHAYGHDAVGGDMSDVNSSPNDPIFHLHHGFVDRSWSTWQNRNPSARTYQIGGYTRQNCGNNCQPTTLNYELTSFGFYPAVTVDQVMNTLDPYLCYKYDY